MGDSWIELGTVRVFFTMTPNTSKTSDDLARRWQFLAIAIMLGVVIWWLSPVIMPFAVAAILAYLGDPLTQRLKRLGMRRTLAVSLVFILFMLIIAIVLLLLVPLLVRQVESLVQHLPDYVKWMRDIALPWFQRVLHIDGKMLTGEHWIADMRQHMGLINNVLGKLSHSGVSAVMWLTNLVLIPVLAFYLLRDWEHLLAWIEAMLPHSVKPIMMQLARESDTMLLAFVRGQLLVMLMLSMVYGLSLTFIGISVGPLIGLLAGVLSFVPYLGFIIGLCASLVAALVQYGDWHHVLMVLVIFVAGNMLEGYVLVPRLVGKKIGLHPVVVIFALLVGGYLFSFFGVLLALPVASVVLVLLRHLGDYYRNSEIYKGAGESGVMVDRVSVSRPKSVVIASTLDVGDEA